MQPDVSTKDRILAAMPNAILNEPTTLEAVTSAEDSLGVRFPNWLRKLYLTCDGFLGPTGVQYLYPLSGDDGVVEFTLFIRDEWKLPWLNRSAIISENGGGGSGTVHLGVYDGKLIKWCCGDDDKFSKSEVDFFAILEREQSLWDEIESETS